MRDLTAFADKHNLTMTLTPSTDFGASSVERLKRFYGQFGFVNNKGRQKDFAISAAMYRLPNTAPKMRETSSGLNPSNIKTRAVAGAAYKSNDIRSTLTHAVDQTTDKPLCNRVKPESLLDDPYAVDDEDAPATCPVCAKKDPRFN
jgi:hypothetical protein